MPVGGGADRFGERRVSYNGVEQTVQAHEGVSVRIQGCGGGLMNRREACHLNAKGPTRLTGRGLPAYDPGRTAAAREGTGAARAAPTATGTALTSLCATGWSRTSPTAPR
ncbi:hypothetical protein GCM10011583_47420 [Streptomyces camponoticapitis]|uniref:Uncharacterized protein n=1 Tax=Streptomyces camponoticapitis TaxID=1616125 RepID=A0ABQ2EFA8_9ACTN|nr:hypothetical protein GCM10011583_47420 [Streptomyces camponoticapitis]